MPRSPTAPIARRHAIESCERVERAAGLGPADPSLPAAGLRTLKARGRTSASAAKPVPLLPWP